MAEAGQSRLTAPAASVGITGEDSPLCGWAGRTFRVWNRELWKRVERGSLETVPFGQKKQLSRSWLKE